MTGSCVARKQGTYSDDWKQYYYYISNIGSAQAGSFIYLANLVQANETGDEQNRCWRLLKKCVVCGVASSRGSVYIYIRERDDANVDRGPERDETMMVVSITMLVRMPMAMMVQCGDR